MILIFVSLNFTLLIQSLRATGKKLTDLLLDMDTLLCSDSNWLLGTWLEQAKALGTTDAVSLRNK